tara:strand:- start:5408 stop:6040 length:633 start_codon:yes stop_codon:yes gene_type:complete
MLILSASITLVAVCSTAWAMTTALNKPLIYYVDSNGQASFGGDRAGASHPLEVEVSFVTKEFLRRTIALNSLTVERDFATSFNLMTASLQAQHQEQFDSWETELGRPFVEYVRAAGIRSTLDFSVLEIENHGGTQFSVRAAGTLSKWPLESDAEAEPDTKSFESLMTLVAVPRTELIPNGLLVSHHSIQYFETENPVEDLKDQKGLESQP